MSRTVIVTSSGHLVEVVGKVARRWGEQYRGLEFCPVDSGAPRRYTQEYDAARSTLVTDQIVRVDCVGCRLAAAKDPALVELVARPHGPLEPSRGV